jgi:6-phosphogluconolactonase/glucosamine-6-phosphate isomerase/deaminase
MLKNGIKIIKVKNPQEGIDACKLLLYEEATKNSVLFLSGGSTPKSLYENLAREKKLKVGAVAMVDERYNGESNEKMIRNTSLIDYLEKDARFYPILQKDENILETAAQYDETVRYLFNYFPKSIGILGIGADGHTGGIPAIAEISQKILDDKSSLVTFYEKEESFYKKRITLTFLALLRLDTIIVLAFGKEKKKALGEMFSAGSIPEIPARFLLKKEISEKTILITDRKI